MCLSLPAQVIRLEADTAVVATDARRFEVGRRLLPEARPGDWVLVNAGQIVRRITSAEAEAIRELLAEIFASGRSALRQPEQNRLLPKLEQRHRQRHPDPPS